MPLNIFDTLYNPDLQLFNQEWPQEEQEKIQRSKIGSTLKRFMESN